MAVTVTIFSFSRIRKSSIQGREKFNVKEK